MKHYTSDTVLGWLKTSVTQPARVAVTLAAEDRAWNPASTNHELTGPGTVVYTQHPDGGVDASLIERAR